MAVTAVVDHHSRWTFEPAVRASPHDLRLRPADHAPGVTAWALDVAPDAARTTWRCHHGWWHGRLTVPGRIAALSLRATTTLVVEPVDPTRPAPTPSPRPPAPDPARPAGDATRALVGGLAALDRPPTVDELVALAGRVADAVDHRARHDGPSRPVATVLGEGWGSCRDAAAVLAEAVRAAGVPARVVTGLLVRLAGQAELGGPWAGAPVPTEDASSLHAWVEAWVEGVGWVGLDPTSGLPTGGGHVPLATAALDPPTPVAGTTEPCRATLDVTHAVRRVDTRPAPEVPAP